MEESNGGNSMANGSTDQNGTNLNKRSGESESADQPARKRRFGERFGAPVLPFAPPVPPMMAPNAAILASLEASIAAQIASTTAALGLTTAPLPAPAPAPKKAKDFSLRLDEQGRQIDAEGRVVQERMSLPAATLKANLQKQKEKEKKNNPYLAHRLGELAPEEQSAVDKAAAARPKRTGFSFVEQGTFIRQAEHMRDREMMREHRRVLRGLPPPSSAPTATAVAAAQDAKEKGQSAQPEKTADVVQFPAARDTSRPVPVVEWWDEPYLGGEKTIEKGATTEELYGGAKLEICKTYKYIQHPKPSTGTVDKDAAAAMPVYLTKPERKRVRRQARAEREREKQDKLALGLIPQPPPKMKLTNFMKILGEQAVADPSKVEMMVQQQVQSRRLNHEMRNQARKLTPEERREKRKAKLAADVGKEIRAAVFRVSDFSHPKRRFKVDVNAQQLNLTGTVIMCTAPMHGSTSAQADAPTAADGTPLPTGVVVGRGVNMVVVEGGPKALRRFIKLMTKRIKWSGEDYDAGGDSDDSDSDDEGIEGGTSGSKPPAGCQLVWQGVIPQRAFSNFRFQECRTVDYAKKAMESKGCVHYWDMVSALSGEA